MGNKFKVSTLNKFLYLGIVIVAIVTFIGFSPKTGFDFGIYCGKLIYIFVIPFALSWITSLLLKNKWDVGNKIFSIILVLLFMVEVGRVVLKKKQEQIWREVRSQKDSTLTVIKDTSANQDAALSSYMAKSETGYEKLIKMSVGEDKKFYEIMSSSTIEMNNMIREWKDACEGAFSDRIFNYKTLKNPNEYENRKKIIARYNEVNNKYYRFVGNFNYNVVNKIRQLNPNNYLVKNALKKKNQFDARKGLLPLLEYYIQYGLDVMNLLKLLEQNDESWRLENGELIIDNESISESYELLVSDIEQAQKTIQELSMKMSQGL